MHFKFTRKSLGIPYAVYLMLFVVAPLLVLFYYAFTNGSGQFTLSNFTGFFTDPNAMGTLFYSFAVAVVTTLVCLLLAYPIACILAFSKLKAKSALVMIFVLPMWINFSLRITALKEILTVFEGNLAMYPFFNAVVGMTYDFLPFMILPIYTTVSRLDGALREAAMDLGADLPACYASFVGSRNHERNFHGISAGDDQLRGTRHAVQQHLHHGKPDRKLFLRVQLERRIDDRADSSWYHLPVHAADGWR